MALLGLLAVLTFSAASASADIRIGEQGSAAGQINEGRGLAVSVREGGDIYLADGGANQRIDQFTPTGEFVRAFGWGIVPGAAAGTGDLTAGSNRITNITTTAGAFSESGQGGRIITGPGIPPGTTIARVGPETFEFTRPLAPGEIEISNPAELTQTAAALTAATGPGNVPTNERQQLAVAATGGEFTLTFTSPKPDTSTFTTADIPYDAPASGPGSVQHALEELSNVGPGNVAVTGSPGGPYQVEFTGRFADVNVFSLRATDVSLSGSASEVTVTTPVEGGGLVETCTTVCGLPSVPENAEFTGSRPGQLNFPREIAVDNDPASSSYGDVYVVDANNFRVDKYSPDGEFLLMFGGEVDQGPHHPGNLCTAQFLAEGDACGEGHPGTGPAHFYKEEPATEAGGAKSWGRGGNNSVAVGSDGTVYVGDYGRIQEFESNGAFLGEFKLPDLEPQFVSSIALDAGGNIYERSETHYGTEIPSTEVPGVREFAPGPAHALLHTFDTGPEEGASEPTHVALDAAGDLFVSDYHNGPFSQELCVPSRQPPLLSGCPLQTFRAFKPDGTLYAEFTSPQVAVEGSRADLGNPGGIALGDSAGALYASSSIGEGRKEDHIAAISLPQPGSPLVTEEHVTDLEPQTATLHAVVNPEQFHTEYHFEYTSTDFVNCGLSSNPACHTVTPAEPDLGSISREDPVQAAISGLSANTTYHWRAVAESTRNGGETVVGTTQTFETLAPVSVRGVVTQTVGPELVKFKFELNPNDSLQATHYTLHFGKTTSYSEGASEGTLGVGSEFLQKEATFTGLQPSTTYHYQLIADNEYGPVETADAEFTTEPSQAEERAAESCPNATRREENSSLALPDCRAYEQVSPAYKAGYPVNLNDSLAPGGESVYFNAIGSFADSNQNRLVGYYVARRTPAGWVTSSPVGPPAGPEYQPSLPVGFDAALDTSLFTALPGSNSSSAGQPGAGEPLLYLGLSDGSFRPASPPLPVPSVEQPINFAGESADFSRIILRSHYKLLPTDPRPNALSATGSDRLYELIGAGGPNPSLALVAEVPPALPAGCRLDDYFGQTTAPLSADGSTLFYDAPLEVHPGAGCVAGTGGGSGPNPSALFARIGAAPPIEISAPPAAQCHPPSPCATGSSQPPHFYGTSPHGNLAWFTTAAPLIDSDTDQTSDLYLAKLEDGELKQLVQASAGAATPSHPTSGKGAGVQGLVRISADGTHVAFVATGVLTTAPNSADDSAVPGADNLYLYDAATGETNFVADLCTAAEKSGSAADSACPASIQEGGAPGERSDSTLWTTGLAAAGYVDQARLTPDGRYLLFDSYGRLAAGDTDAARDLYRYDFSTGQLLRLSFGRSGNDANGNDDAYNAEIPALSDQRSEAYKMAEDEERAISANGAVAIFETAAPLTSRDTNVGARPSCANGQATATGCDVYEWEESGHGSCQEASGCIRLISSGLDPHSISGAVLSSSGSDITFITPRSLVPADTDGVADVYDARENGGFPYSSPPVSCGGNETCHGQVPPEPIPPNISTPNFVGPGNGSIELKCAKGKVRVKKHGQVRCVAKNHHKAKHHKKQKRANANRGGGE